MLVCIRLTLVSRSRSRQSLPGKAAPQTWNLACLQQTRAPECVALPLNRGTQRRTGARCSLTLEFDPYPACLPASVAPGFRLMGLHTKTPCPLSLRTSDPSSRAAFHHVRSVTSVIPDTSANARIRRFADAPICSIAQYSSSHADCRTGAMRCPAHGIRNAKARPFGTSRHRPRIRDYENGCSSEGLCGVNRLAPFSVMYMSSSRRTPNSPGM